MNTDFLAQFTNENTSIIFNIFLVVLLIGITFFISSLLKLIPFYRRIFKFIANNLFIVLLLPALCILFMMLIGVDTTKIPNFSFIKELSVVIFSAGVFTTALNFLDSLNVFKKNFKEIIVSEEFENLITSKIELLAYSEEHLRKQNNLDNIWKTVTLCKYNNDFPALFEKIKSKLDNNFFNRNNITYYYKNFQLNYSFELIDNDIIKVIEKASFTIIRPNHEKFEFDYYTMFSKDDDQHNPTIEMKFKNNSDPDFQNSEPKREEISDKIKLICSNILHGHLEYHIESTNISFQNINNDNLYRFGSGRIIDDLTVTIDNCENLNVTFAEVDNNKFYTNSLITDRKSYINRDILLPGEKFILFLHKQI